MDFYLEPLYPSFSVVGIAALVVGHMDCRCQQQYIYDDWWTFFALVTIEVQFVNSDGLTLLWMGACPSVNPFVLLPKTSYLVVSIVSMKSLSKLMTNLTLTLISGFFWPPIKSSAFMTPAELICASRQICLLFLVEAWVLF